METPNKSLGSAQLEDGQSTSNNEQEVEEMVLELHPGTTEGGQTLMLLQHPDGTLVPAGDGEFIVSEEGGANIIVNESGDGSYIIREMPTVGGESVELMVEGTDESVGNEQIVEAFAGNQVKSEPASQIALRLKQADDANGMVSDAESSDIDLDEDDHSKQSETIVDERSFAIKQEPTDKIKKSQIKVVLDVEADLHAGEMSGIADPGKRCRYCATQFKTVEACLKHEMEHRREKPFECDVCKKRFKSSSHLVTHKLIHTERKTFACKVCGNKYKLEQSLTKHFSEEHSTNCRFCTETFTDSRARARHELEEHRTELKRKSFPIQAADPSSRAFKCPHCGRLFSSRQNLDIHVRTHTGEKPFICSICPKSFSTRAVCQQHERLHRGELPFKCELCPKAYASGAALQAHEKYHVIRLTKQQPYHCKVCNKGFNQTTHLKAHEQVHTGERPYKCQLCPRSYFSSSALSTHMQNHTGRAALRCKRCRKSFKDASLYKLHVDSLCTIAPKQVRPRSGEMTKEEEALVLNDNDLIIKFTSGKRSRAKKERNSPANVNNKSVEEPVVKESIVQKVPLGNQPAQNVKFEVIEEETEEQEEIDDGQIDISQLSGQTEFKDLTVEGGEETCQALLLEDGTILMLGVEPTPEVQTEEVVNDALSTLKMEGIDNPPVVVFNTVDEKNPTPKAKPVLQRVENEASEQVIVEMDQDDDDVLQDIEVEVDYTDLKTKHVCQFCGNAFKSDNKRLLHEIQCVKKVLPSSSKQVSIKGTDESNEPVFAQHRLAYACHVCERIFTTKETFDEHVKSHSEGADEAVERKIGQGSQENLGRAYPVRVVKNPSALTCNLCGRQFTRKDYYQNHIRSHTGETPFECQVCHDRFVSQQALRMHQTFHQELKVNKPPGAPRRFQCRFCTSSYTSSAQRNMHERKHTGEKPYQCSYCEKTFRLKAACTTHERHHTGDKPYQCRFCDKRFSQMQHRTTHERLHSGEKPFECKMCGKRYASAGALDWHVKAHTGQNRKR